LPRFSWFMLFRSISSMRVLANSSRFQAVPADSISIVLVDLETVNKVKELGFDP